MPNIQEAIATFTLVCGDSPARNLMTDPQLEADILAAPRSPFELAIHGVSMSYKDSDIKLEELIGLKRYAVERYPHYHQPGGPYITLDIVFVVAKKVVYRNHDTVLPTVLVQRWEYYKEPPMFSNGATDAYSRAQCREMPREVGPQEVLGFLVPIGVTLEYKMRSLMKEHLLTLHNSLATVRRERDEINARLEKLEQESKTLRSIQEGLFPSG